LRADGSASTAATRSAVAAASLSASALSATARFAFCTSFCASRSALSRARAAACSTAARSLSAMAAPFWASTLALPASRTARASFASAAAAALLAACASRVCAVSGTAAGIAIVGSSTDLRAPIERPMTVLSPSSRDENGSESAVGSALAMASAASAVVRKRWPLSDWSSRFWYSCCARDLVRIEEGSASRRLLLLLPRCCFDALVERGVRPAASDGNSHGFFVGPRVGGALAAEALVGARVGGAL